MGLFSDEKHTFTALAFSDLLPKDVSVPGVKKSLYFTMNDMQDFNNNYFAFKRAYRPRIKDQWMMDRGFSPSTKIDREQLSEYKLKLLIHDTYDSDISTIMDSTVDTGLIAYQVSFYLQNNGYDWSNHKKILTIQPPQNPDGTWPPKIEYNTMVAKYKANTNDPNILDDINTIVATFTNSFDASIDPYVIEIDNEFKDMNIYVLYSRNVPSGSDEDTKNEFYVYITERSDKDNLFDKKTITLSPIVPLKENGTFRICESASNPLAQCKDGEYVRSPRWSYDYSDTVVDESEFDKCKEGAECGVTAVTEYLDKYGIDPVEVIDALDDKDDDGEDKIKNSYLLTGMIAMDPYVIPPGTYSSTDAQNFSPRLLKDAVKSADGKSYYLSDELVKWWAHKNRRSRENYARVMFRTFETYGSGSTNIRLSGMSLSYEINMKTEDHDGVLDGAKIYSKDEDGNKVFSGVSTKYAIIEYKEVCVDNTNTSPQSGYYKDKFVPNSYKTSEKICQDPVMKRYSSDEKVPIKDIEIKISWQVSKVKYRTITVTKFKENISISGHWFSLYGNGAWTSDSDKEDDNKGKGAKLPRIIIPKFIVDEATFGEYVSIKEYGMHIVVYAEKTVVVEWWKKFIGFAIGLLFCLLGPAACSIGQLVINWIISYAVSYVLEQILSSIDNPYIRALVKLAIGAIQLLAGANFDISALTSEVWLDLAENLVIEGFNAYQQVKMIEMKEEREMALKSEAEYKAAESIEESIEDSSGLILSNDMLLNVDKSVHYNFMNVNGPEALYSKIDNMFNYDVLYDVRGNVELRKQVKNG